MNTRMCRLAARFRGALALASRRRGAFRKQRQRRNLFSEFLEPRQVLSAVTMTDQEQLLLELVNRARSNPIAELAGYTEISNLNDGLTANSISSQPKAPLAPNQALIDAAGSHSQDMLDNDFFRMSIHQVNPPRIARLRRDTWGKFLKTSPGAAATERSTIAR